LKKRDANINVSLSIKSKSSTLIPNCLQIVAAMHRQMKIEAICDKRTRNRHICCLCCNMSTCCLGKI